MRRFIMLIFSLVAILNWRELDAIPAYPGIITVQQPTGATIQLRQVGDEYSHILRTVDGHVVVQCDDGGYYYAYVQDGRLVGSDILAHDPGQRSDDENNYVAGVNDQEALSTMTQPRRTASAGVGLSSVTKLPTTGSPKIIVILVEFTDKKFTDNVDRFTTVTPHDYISDLLNQQGFNLDNSNGSVRDYFTDASFGVFTPQFDVYGPYTLNHNTAYYGGDSSTGLHDVNKLQLIHDACAAADDDVNFGDYAYDGSVPLVALFYAGVGQNTSAYNSDIWPSANSFGEEFDGVTIDRFACSNTVNIVNRPIGIGTFIHEFSHVLGLPDLYSGILNVTPGFYSVLDYGMYLNDSRCPAGYGAFERNALHWIEPTAVALGERVELSPIEQSNTCRIITTDSDNEIFLIENRQQQSWDKYLPGHGLLVWHIDYDQEAFSTWPNSDESHQRVDIIEANGTANSASTNVQAGYPFPGTASNTSLTPYTTPSLLTWDEYASDTDSDAATADASEPLLSLDISLIDITEEDGNLSFYVDRGNPFTLREVIANEATDITNTAFTANWLPVEDATSYFLTITDQNNAIVADYDAKEFTATTATITDLDSNGQYAYSLYASDGYSYTKPSNRVAVDLVSTSVPTISLSDVADSTIYTLQGVRVTNPHIIPGIYLLQQQNKFRKVLIK
jgi:M6 family metalloprotease-like protein